MATLQSLARRLNRLADSAGQDLYRERRDRIARAVIRELLLSTPVDTTRALSNWRIGDPSAPIEPHSVGSEGSSRAASLATALADAERAIKAGKLSNALVIFNSVPYIRKLNEGSSSQAPAGFVERAILAGKLAARG